MSPDPLQMTPTTYYATAHVQVRLLTRTPGEQLSVSGLNKRYLPIGEAEVLEICWEKPVDVEIKPSEVTEHRPWGSFTVLADEPHFKLKQLLVNPGNRLSLQRHQKREEHWLITQGQPEITINETTRRYRRGDYLTIPCRAWHRLANAADSKEIVEIIELQLGDYFGEDDIERKADDYGRM